MKHGLRHATASAIAVCVILCASCSRISLPTLEAPECTQARDQVRRFYSNHFGGSLSPSVEDLKRKQDFVTPSLYRSLESRADTPEDYFTATDDYPRAFRVAGCRAESTDRVVFEILLFWRDDQRSEQGEIETALVRIGDKWLIDSVNRK